MSLPFLLEIGTEEIPDWMIVGALNQLQDAFQKLLDQQGVGGMVKSVDATPRRLVLRAEGLRPRQEDSEELVLGPPKSAGAGAAAGFAKKMGAMPDALSTETTAKGEYLGFRKQVKGRETRDVLAEALPELILKIQWPKTMYWNGKGGERFIRPIRWLVALLGADIVPFQIGGVFSGSNTQGHRLLGKSSIPVTVDNFVEQLRENGVILSADERRAKIETLLHRARPDPDLLETLVYMTEWPTPILGSFDDSYLELPREVLVTVMRHHQRYFSVEDSAGNLAPHFIAVMNTNADPEGLVRKGNERVLRARFNDARFFWEKDLEKTLEERFHDLANVTFQAKLSKPTYQDKAERIAQMAVRFADPYSHVAWDYVDRAARLCKCDLTTEMVKEFTDLQGIMGGLYAQAQGEVGEVWTAIYDHYKPTSAEDRIPSNIYGQLVALADKLDTLRQCFAVGMAPTGSKDPLALRRAALGVIRICVEGDLDFSMNTLVADNDQLREFLIDRLRHYFRDIKTFKYDEVNAVLAGDMKGLVDFRNRMSALAKVRTTPDFEPLATSFKRTKKILVQAGIDIKGFSEQINVDLLEPGPELALHDGYKNVSDHNNRYLGGTESDYVEALIAIASLRPAVDLFFDKVLVNAPDEAIRRNRLTLLHNLMTEFSTIADFSEIVTQ